MIRVLRVIETGQWCGPSIEDASFPDDGSAWADAVAVTLGLEAGALEVVDAEADPRTGDLLEDPNVTPEPEPVIDRGDLLLAIFDVLGKETARSLARDYPDAVLAIDHGNWAVLGESMADMLADEALTQQQAADLNALFEQFGVSVG